MPGTESNHSSSRRIGFATEAFTLIEIMVVLGIIGTILALSFQAYSKSAATSRVSSVVGTVARLKSAITTLMVSPNPPAMLPVTESYFLIGGPYPQPSYSNVGTGSASALDYTVGAAATLDNLLLTAGCLQQPISVKMGAPGNTPTTTGAYVTWSTSLNQWTGTGAQPTVVYGCGNEHVPTAVTDITRAECGPVDPSVTPGFGGDSYCGPVGEFGINFYLDGVTSLPSNQNCAYLVIVDVPQTDAYNLAYAVDGPAMTASAGSAQTKGPVEFMAPTNGLTTIYYYILSQ